MIKLEIAANGTQTITKVCNMCGCHIDDLAVEDILVKGNTDLNVFDKDGNCYKQKYEGYFPQKFKEIVNN